MKTYFVEIVDLDTGKVLKRLGPMSLSVAERVEDGANINLNHDTCYTRIVQIK